MKFKEIFKMVVRCFCEEKSEPGSIKPKWIKVCWKCNGNNMGMVLKKEAGKAEVEQLSKKEMKVLTKG